jgi:hypothetical protein
MSGDREGVGVWSIGVYEGKKPLQLGVAKCDILMEGLCGAAVGVSGGQVARHIGDQEKVRTETFGVRIRDPTDLEILIKATGGEKVNSHVRVRVSSRKLSGVEKS